MLNTTKKIIALLTALVLVFSLAGCSTTDDDYSSGGVVYQDKITYIDADDTNNADNTQQGDNAQQTGDSQQGGSTQQSGGQQGGSTQQSGNGVNPEDYRGSTVVFATTILSAQDESGPVIDKFEKDYGITVKEILVGDNVNEIAGLLASGTNVDVMRSNGDFPAAMAVLQPITAAKLDMTDPIWDQGTFEYTTFGGEPYLCNTISNVWTENAAVFYSKNLLKRANCYTPEEYDKQGKWTWDAFAAIAKAVDSIDGMGTGIRGAYDDGGYLLGSIGAVLYKFENGKFTNGLNDPLHREAMAKIATWNKEGFWTNVVDNNFTKGNTGICVGLAGWCLKKNGAYADYNWNDIGFYHMPAYKEGMPAGGTGMLKAWGICRGADHPVGAGIFLRQYLDASNYDTRDAFISDEAATFFFKTTDGMASKNYTPTFTYGDSNEKMTGFFEWDWEAFKFGDPNQVNMGFDKLSDSVDKACKVLNDFVAKNTGIRE